MTLFILIALLIFAVLALLPQWWIKHTLAQHGQQREDLPGTGSELAAHLLYEMDLHDVRVIRGGKGQDYYDPSNKKVSLSPEHFDGKSLAAVAVAAHEVGHAIQHHNMEPDFLRRIDMNIKAQKIEKYSAWAMMVTPVLPLLTRLPHTSLLTIAFGLAGMLAATWVHVLTLPVETDASFNKALPMLQKMEKLSETDLKGARQVLRAAAFTYVAATLSSLLSIGRWLMMIRR
ncbi:zinc metallopeptidase [Pelagibaculum spongiae]|uniref:Peptidase n=1 Tax=Pelagibaculum spongiae TaxID=2080658 RepID=A0A2V1H2Z4_9GAMM|nr:zinc metallopeptidase [Pelagibaculum spongiae]PVZ70379.1 peptidase [Pelagibaculum spongiae]